MAKQVKSKKRVADHGEVFTAEREVKAMCDLVADECLRIDSRFLEPAVGEGVFLAEVLTRKLSVVKEKYKKSAYDYERNAILALTSIYGVDILADNAQVCRDKLFALWDKEYTAVCKKEASDTLYQNCSPKMAFHATFDTITIAVDERQQKHPSFSF